MRTLVFGLLLCSFVYADYTKYSDINYNLDKQSEKMNTLDIYVPKQISKPLPVMIYVHGGGWCIGDKKRVHHKATLFTDEQYIFVSINYRLSPFPLELKNKNRIMFPDHPNDVGEAIAWLHKNIAEYKGDNEKFFLIGHSAGAHLVALVATDESYLKRYDISTEIIRGTCALDTAAYDVAKRTSTAGGMFFNAFGTEEENKKYDTWRKASPSEYADREDGPMLLVTQKGQEMREQQNYGFAKLLSNCEVYLIDKTHREVNVDLGNPQDTTMLTTVVMTFFQRLR
ncbi:alpha/beta hydrolase [Candidatus Uabimicrobium amorphum]|uniref:BD-FAE-like domain-containing protein n=1 Tax=Uabimicrobium amorphum TaxID=2596890 RepID=A0A5S9IJS5_UABAM|nr:alpha/beta hydrolase [Candidatus Uabimicrobium amorphum]BBM82756.1 hypothetical protein UABAM_01099 [Candidatus Uabimicrobium amorphum]